jgi:uncharacterized protein YfiM (DUF2279 family)
MKKLIAVVLFLVNFSCFAACTSQDQWTGPDKKAHFLVGAALGSAGTLVTGDPKHGVLLGAFIGAAKEVYDSRHPENHTCSMQDFVVTLVGAVAGAYGTKLVIGPRYVGVKLEF